MAQRREPPARRRRPPSPPPTPEEELLSIAHQISDDVRGIKAVIYIWAGVTLVASFVAFLAVLVSNAA